MRIVPLIRGLVVLFLAGAGVAVLAALLAPVLFRQGVELARAPLDARYRAPSAVAHSLERDGALLGLIQRHTQDLFRTDLHPAGWVGSLEGLARLEEGAASFALIRSSVQDELEGVVGIAGLGEEFLHIVVAADSPLETFANLAGTRIGLGAAYSDGALLAERLLASSQLTPTPQTLAMPLEQTMAALANEELEAAFLLAPVHDAVVGNLLASGDFRLLSLPQHAPLAGSLPGVRAASIPAGAYGPNRSIPSLDGGPLPTVAVEVLLVARPDAPYWRAWSLVAAAHAPAFTRAARWRGVTVAEGLPGMGLPLHRAARDYQARSKPISAGRFERTAFTVGALLLLAALWPWLRARRDARLLVEQRAAIIPYFESMDKLGQAAERARDTAELRTIQNGIAQLQQQAEQEWLEGMLDTTDMGRLHAALLSGHGRAANRHIRMELMHLRDQLDHVRRGMQPSPPKPPPQAPPPARPRSVAPPELDDELEDVPTILLQPEKDDHAKGHGR